MNRIAGFNELSMIDWDGMLTAVVFLSGCNWRCPYCHNSDLWEIKSEVSEDEFFSYLSKRKNWLDGVVILGGEPLISRDVIPFAEKIKKEGLKVKVDTNGSKPDVLEEIMKKNLADYVAMDIKTRLTEEKYALATGVSEPLDNVKKSIKLLLEGSVDFEFRTTMVPEIVDEDDLIFNLSFIPAGTRYILQQFSPDNTPSEHFREVTPYTDEDLERMRNDLKDRGLAAAVRGEE